MGDQSGQSVPDYLRHVNAALALREVPDLPSAVEHLQVAAEQAPTDAVVHLLLGLTLQDLEQFDAAQTSLQRAFDLDTGSPDARQALGLLLLHREDFVRAEEVLQPLIHCDDPNPAIIQAYAVALAQRERRPEAIDLLETALTRHPDDAEIASQLANLLKQDHQVERAIEVLQQAVSKTASVDLRCDLAVLLCAQSRYDDALATLEEARRAQPEHERIWRGLAYCHLHHHDAERALLAADRAIELNSLDVRSWQYKANALSLLGRKEEALQTLSQAIEFERKLGRRSSRLDVLLLFRVIELLGSQGPSAALMQLDQDLALSPDHSGLSQLKAELLLSEKKYHQTLEAVQQALANQAVDESSAAWHTFQAYHGLGQPDMAWAALQPALQSDVNATQVERRMEQIGRNLYAIGEYQAAASVFEHLQRLAEDSSIAVNNLAFVLIGLGQLDRAEPLLDLARQLGYKPLGVTLANLGYLHLLRQNYSEAITIFQQALAVTDASQEPAILRAAFWHQGKFSAAEIDRFPQRSVSIRLALQANLAVASFLDGQTSWALQLVEEAISDDPQDSIGYRILGCLYLAQEDPVSARAAWTQALDKTAHRAELEVIRDWLNQL